MLLSVCVERKHNTITCLSLCLSLYIYFYMSILPLSTSVLLYVLFCGFQDRVFSQDLAKLVESVLHLGNACQLGLQTLFLLREGEPRGRVQLLEPPAALAVKLQQVGVVLPERGPMSDR